MKNIILVSVLFIFLSCGSGGGEETATNISASEGANVSVVFSGENFIDQEISSVTRNCLACCIDDELDNSCLASLDISCAPEDFTDSGCEEEVEDEV